MILGKYNAIGSGGTTHIQVCIQPVTMGETGWQLASLMFLATGRSFAMWRRHRSVQLPWQQYAEHCFIQLVQVSPSAPDPFSEEPQNTDPPCSLRATGNTDRTDGNARSSRSHAIFTVRVQHTGIGADGRQQLVRGRLLLVDLAGAENASAAEAGSVAQKQGAGINVGLGTLQQVIADVAKTGKSAKYRDSNLTYLLKPGEPVIACLHLL